MSKRMMAVGRIASGATATVTVERICAGCKASLGTVEWEGAAPGTVTHGICEACSSKMLQQTEEGKP